MNRSAWLWGVLVLVASCLGGGTDGYYSYRAPDGRTYTVRQPLYASTSEPTVTYTSSANGTTANATGAPAPASAPAPVATTRPTFPSVGSAGTSTGAPPPRRVRYVPARSYPSSPGRRRVVVYRQGHAKGAPGANTTAPNAGAPNGGNAGAPNGGNAGVGSAPNGGSASAPNGGAGAGSDPNGPNGSNGVDPNGSSSNGQPDASGAAPVPSANLPPPAHPTTNGEVGLRVIYEPSKNAGHEQLRTSIEQAALFDALSTSLNSVVRFPHLVTVEWGDCGMVNAFWDPTNARIVMCYELVDYLSSLFAKVVPDATQRNSAVMSAVLFSFLHEFGHGAIAMFKLPAVGREEDAVDQLAALTLIKAGGVSVAMLGAEFFHLLALADPEKKPSYFDEHSFDDQRFYNVLCLVYGSDPQKYASLVGDKTLPPSRAQRCPDEYKKLGAAWDSLLKTHVRAKPETVKTTGTCDGAAKRVSTILSEKLRVEVAGEHDQAAAKDEKARIDKLVGDVRGECRKNAWPKASISCVEQAVSIGGIVKCNVLK